MASNEILPVNPASLAYPQAELVLRQGDEFAVSTEDEHALVVLGNAARALDFEDQEYFVETSRALSIPISFEAEGPVIYKSFHKLAFEGVFKCYSKVMVGHIIGAQSVRAYCLTFDEALLLPYFDSLPEDHLLHVPVFAVDSIEQTSV